LHRPNSIAQPNNSSSDAGAAPQPSPVTSTQQFTGGGVADFLGGNPRIDLGFRGAYTSNGQLGIGRVDFHLATGAPSPMVFTRSDGLALHGVMSSLPLPKCGFSAVGPAFCSVVNVSGGADMAWSRSAC